MEKTRASSKKTQSVTVIGAGAFGTAMGLTCFHAGHKITFLSKDTNQVKEINQHHTNTSYFKDFALPPEIHATHDMSTLQQADAIVIAIPAQVLPDLITEIKPHLAPHTPIILTNKGIIDHDPLPLFPIEILKKAVDNPVALLSGPNFAIEIVNNLPAATSLAIESKDFLGMVELFAHPLFRVYPTTDFIGIQVAGVVKNILAIGSGIVEAGGFGANAAAALITRGLAEMTRLGLALGARLETFMGLAGVGDLMLTCTSIQSRNFSLGVKLARGDTVDAILEKGHPLCEGYYSIDPILKLAKAYNVDMPLCQAVKKIVTGTSLDDVALDLFARPPCFEIFKP